MSIAYTPGVAEPCKVIAADKNAAYTYTWKANTVAVTEALVALVTDDKLNEDFIMPEAFVPRVAEVVSQAVKAHI